MLNCHTSRISRCLKDAKLNKLAKRRPYARVKRIAAKKREFDLKKSIGGVIVSIIIVIGILYLFIGGNFQELYHNIIEANFWLVLLAIGIYFVEVGIWTGRWKTALRAVDHDINFSSMYWICHGGKFFTHVTPIMKASGDPFRAYLAKKTHDLPYDIGFGTLIAEQAVSVPVILTFLTAGLVLWLYLSTAIWVPIIVGILMSLVIVFFLPFTRWLAKRKVAMSQLTRLIGWINEKLGRDHDDEFVTDSLEKFYKSSQFVMEHKKSGIFMASLTILLYILVLFRFYLIFLALGFSVPLYVPLLGATMPIVLGLIPFSPGGLIFVEGGMIGIFVALGIPTTTAASAVIIERGISYFISSLAGAFATSYLGLKIWKS